MQNSTFGANAAVNATEEPIASAKRRFARGALAVCTSLVLATAGFAPMAFATEGDPETDPAGADDPQVLAPNLEKAIAAFSFASENVIEVAPGDDVAKALRNAGYNATDEEKWAVHAASGAYQLDYAFVPKNVVFVAEDDSTFTTEVKSSHNAMMDVAGSLYGGTYYSKGTDFVVIDFDAGAYTGGNGVARFVHIKKASNSGFRTAYGSTGTKFYNCTATNTGVGGFMDTGGSTIDLLQNCVSHYNQTGLNMTHSNVKKIVNCDFSHNKGRGISTQSELANQKQNNCTIGSISNSTFVGNGEKGIYLEMRCTLGSITGSTIKNSTDAGIDVEAAGKIGKIEKCVFQNNSGSNLVVDGEGDVGDRPKNGAYVVVGNSNKFLDSKRHGISVTTGGVLKISGKSNLIQGNKEHGIALISKNSKVAKLYLTGTGTRIYKNKKYAIALGLKHSYAKISKKAVKYSRNGKGKIYKSKGGKLKMVK